MPLAFFITFTTYGTWLHGSGRGKGSVDRDHNVYGEPFVEAEPDRERRNRDAMAQDVYIMSEPERNIVRDAIVEFCRERGWALWAVHVRRNHVHVVVSADRDPGRMMSDLKARASRQLNDAGYDSAKRRRWTRHGSTKYLFRREDVEAKIAYTLDEQGPRMAVFDGREQNR